MAQRDGRIRMLTLTAVVLMPLSFAGCGGGDDGQAEADAEPDVGETEVGVEDRVEGEDVVRDDAVGDETEESGEACGDGIRDSGEECDDGNADDGDECLSTCELASCGDGHVQRGVEECDDGADNSDVTADACRTTCLAAHCGDGVTDADEGCDDGNTVGGDGCSAVCVLESCGNGVVEPGEECDDGNFDDTDACPRTCRTARCGDGYVWADHEQCDGDPPASCATSCGTAGGRACSACAWETVCTPPDEACNAVDDDCDTRTDDGYLCSRGRTALCTTTCGSTGSGICTDACLPPSGADCDPPLEWCNGEDDDCDTRPDNGLACARGATVPCTATCGTIGSGTCTAACLVPSGAACTPPAEVCNAADDDCDMSTDEDFFCVRGRTVPCTTSCGTAGTGSCSAACETPGVAACTPPAEVCNAADDDCDGSSDETFACISGTTRTCTAGTCSGTQSCDTSCALRPCDFGPPPANDVCGSAAIDISAAGVFVGSSCAAMNDYNYTCGTTTAGSPDIVFRLDLPATRDVILDTLGTSFDAMLFVRSTGACPGTTAVRCDDNSGGGTPGQARIQWPGATAGTYWVILDGAGAGSRGSWVLNVSISIPSPPAFDVCSGAAALSANGLYTGTTQLALDDHSAPCAGGTGGRDVWYTFTNTTRQLVYLDTVDGGTWNSVLDVVQGTCPSPALSVGCSDDACSGSRSQWVGVLDPGTYYVVVDGAAAGQEGSFSLLFQRSACIPAVRITGNGDYNGTNVGLLNEYTSTCGGAGPDVEYYLALCGSRSVTATTCNSTTTFDTILYFRAGSCSGTELGCNDDYTSCTYGTTRSMLTSTLGQGLNILIVDDYSSATGTFRVTISGM